MTTVQNTFRALADPTRRSILMLLSQQDMTIGDVVKQFDISRAAVKKHLTILEQGHLISVQTAGRERINKLEPLALKLATDWLNHFSHFWDQHLNKLHDAIEHEQRGKND